MKVMKFGGSSVKDSALICRVGDIVKASVEQSDIAVVLSAMKGITDQLIDLTLLAEKGDQSYHDLVRMLKDRKARAVQELIPGDKGNTTRDALFTMLDELEGMLHGIELVKECSPRSHDLAVSFGERMSCTLFADYLCSSGIEAMMIDARQMIRTDDNHKNAEVYFNRTYPLIKEKLADVKGIPVITGFIASTEEGVTTTLGRNGSDFTASIVAAAEDAEAVEIWTDVDGVLSADPRVVDGTFVIDEISIQEAMELSYFGAEVIHPYTMLPVVEKDIPIRIKNTLNPSAPGTLIARNVKRHEHAITGIASIADAAIINVEGGGMLGMPGVASRVFSALAKAKVNIIMISQASSEHSICVVIRQAESGRALSALKEELEEEVKTRRIQNFDLKENLEIIAVIGENMRGTPGISGKLFKSLGDAGVNVLVIAQGSSERNISFVVSKNDRNKALRVVHKAFL